MHVGSRRGREDFHGRQVSGAGILAESEAKGMKMTVEVLKGIAEKEKGRLSIK